MRFIGWIVAALFAQTVFAADCVPKAEMQEIAQHFTQFRNIANADYCYDGSQTTGLIQSLMFMRKTQFSASMPKSGDEIFSGTFANDWYGYFIGRITDMHVEASCPKGVGAFVYFFGTTMYVCPMMLTANFTALDRASVFMHEARHIDGYPHTTCTRGPRAGLRGACDDHIGDAGSYAVTVETYAQIAKYAPDIHPALRAYSRASAVIYADEAFEQPTRIDRQPEFLLMTENKEFYSMKADGSYAVTAKGSSPTLGHILMRAQHMIIYPDNKNEDAKYVFMNNVGDITQAAGDFATEYNALPVDQRANLVDMHIGAQWGARVYRNMVHFTCDPGSPNASDISLNGATAASLIYPNGYDRAMRSVQLVTTTGSILEIGCNGTTPQVRTSPLVFDQTYKRIYKSGNAVLGLTGDGKLFELRNGQSTLVPVQFNGSIHELVPSQSYNFFDSGV